MEEFREFLIKYKNKHCMQMAIVFVFCNSKAFYENENIFSL